MVKDAYKASAFNYCCKKEEGALIYNTLYNTFARLDEAEYKKYIGSLEADRALAEEFVENGLWVEKGLDEKKHYLACARAYTMSGLRPLSLTITTTLKCNARCPYCYEKGVRQADLYHGAAEDIIKFMKQKTKQDFLYITWFGGEPLLNMEIMDTLSQRLEEEGYGYSAFIITNGSKIDSQVLEEKLEKWHVQDMQVTLDGTKQKYEERKNYYNKEEGEFYRIIENICGLAKKKISISIRLNIERENMADMVELVKELGIIFANDRNVVFYPAFLTGTGNPLAEEEKIACVKEMLECLHGTEKITASTKFYSLPRPHACMNGDPNSFSIDVDGYLYTCEHQVGKPGYAIGNIRDSYPVCEKRGRAGRIRKECLACVFLPKCFGGCESSYMGGDVPCMIEKYMIKALMELL